MSDDTNMADTVDKVLGVGSALTGVVSFIFYRLYRSRTETARQVRQIPVWHPDLKLQDHLNIQDDNCLAYAAVEGVVTDMGRTLRSHYGKDEGVVMRSQIVEHKSKRVNGFWNDMRKVIKDNTDMVPFAIVKQGGDSTFRVEVTDPKLASELPDELETTYDRFEPSKASLVQIGLDRLFGEVTKGIQETEQMLLTGTSVLGIGKVVLEHGQMKLSPPDSNRSYIITKMRLIELVRHYEAQSTTYKVVAIISACIGGGFLSYIIYRHAARWLEKRKQRLQFDEIRRSIAEQRRRQSQNSQNNEATNDQSLEFRDEDTCVVCLTNARHIIALPCGHLAMCADCAEALPSPKLCPVCRADVEKFMPVFRP